MPSLLRLDSSAAAGRNSVSRTLTGEFDRAWTARGGDRTVVHRDLHADPVPHLPDAELHWPRDMRPDTVVDAAAERLQYALIDELLAADVLLLGVPLYNYGLPSTLKAWIDHVHVPGVTAALPGGSTRPLAGRPAVVVTAQGASYDDGSPTAGWDHATPHLEIVLGEVFGMSVTTVPVPLTLAGRLPALAGFREVAEQNLAGARARLGELASTLG
ncbi:NAD(P)H-dependent oxidoreductase [Pseudonocardia nematodicida]|uniref:FMN dependent NADH:quinone oxidoreductase n=1 Tax=Pseudonocardia nematodicida TaxID=1206997 RepID=A0ABV1KJL2_9PSEU